MKSIFPRKEKNALKEIAKQNHMPPKEIKRKNLAKIKKAIMRMAENPTEEDIDGVTIYGVPAMSLTKKDLIVFTIYQEKRFKESQERAIEDISLMSEICDARVRMSNLTRGEFEALLKKAIKGARRDAKSRCECGAYKELEGMAGLGMYQIAGIARTKLF